MEPSTWLRLALTVVVLFTRSNGAPYEVEEPYGGRDDPHITPTDDWKKNVGGHEAVKHLGNTGIVPAWGDSTHRSPLPVNEGWRPRPADMHATQVGVAPRPSPVVMPMGNINIIPDLTDHSPLYGHQRPAGRGMSSKGWPSKSSSEEKDSGSKDSSSNSKSDCHSTECRSRSHSKSSSESKSKESGSKQWRHRSKGSGWREAHHRSKHSKERKSHKHHHRSKHSKERKSHHDYHHGTHKHHYRKPGSEQTVSHLRNVMTITKQRLSRRIAGSSLMFL